MRASNPNNQENKLPETAAEYLEYTKGLLGEGNTNSAPSEPTRQEQPRNYQTQVNELIKEVTVDKNGKFIYPDNTPEHLKYAVAAEKKFRDTQAGFTKNSMTLKEMEAENIALREQLAKNATTGISDEAREELEELKFTDPDAWFAKKMEIEQQSKSEFQGRLNEELKEVKTVAGREYEVARRATVLEEFNANRATPLTVEILDNDIPPRIAKRLVDGITSFEEYLSEADEYLSKGKVVSNPNVDSGTSLASAAGSTTPQGEAYQLENGALDYNNVTF